MEKTFRNKTTVVLGKDTRDKLANLGSKDSTFDSIILELIEKVEKKNE